MSSSEDELILTPNKIIERNRVKAIQQILSPKSKKIYHKTYQNFMNWRSQNRINTFSESDLLIYFDELSKTLRPPSLWSVYSMLKTTLKIKHNTDMKTYTKLTTFIKRFSSGYKSKKSKVLTANQVETFLKNAPDKRYLATKVALIFGISGGCRGIELSNMTVDDVKTDTHLQAITLPNTRTNQQRTFIVKGEYLKIVKKYQALRPQNVPTNRFFLNYQNGKCTKQVIGKNKFASLPKEIASFLNLENPEDYTGHCFRRTSANLLAYSGSKISMFKQHGRWKSDDVKGGYIVENKCNNTEATKLAPNDRDPFESKDWRSHSQPLNENPETSKSLSLHTTPSTSSKIQTYTVSTPGNTITINIQNCSNFTINFN